MDPNPLSAFGYAFTPIGTDKRYPYPLLEARPDLYTSHWDSRISSPTNLSLPSQNANIFATPVNLSNTRINPAAAGSGDIAFPSLGNVLGSGPAVANSVLQDYYSDPQSSYNLQDVDATPFPHEFAAIPASYMDTNVYPAVSHLEPANSYVTLGQDNYPARGSNFHFLSGSHYPPMAMASGVQVQYPVTASLPNIGSHASSQGQVGRQVEPPGVQSDPAVNSSDAISHGGVSTPNDDQNRKTTSTEASRVNCPSCNKTFKRRYDMRRHAQKHSSDKLRYQCGVKDCGYEGSYRLDKLYSHLKNCHSKGNDWFGAIRLQSRGKRIEDFFRPASEDFSLPASGDCSFSQELLESDAFAKKYFMWTFEHYKTRWLNPLLSEDGMGLKRIAKADIQEVVRSRPRGGAQV